MKKYLIVSIAVLLCILLIGCSSGESQVQSVALDKEVKYENISSLKVNESWPERDGDNLIYIDLPDKGLITLSGGNMVEISGKLYLSDEDIHDYVYDFFKGLYKDGSITPSDGVDPDDINYTHDSLKSTAQAAIDFVFPDDGAKYKGYCRVVTNGGLYGYVIAAVPESSFDEMKKTLELCVATLSTEFVPTVDTGQIPATARYSVGDKVEITGIVIKISNNSFTLQKDNLEFKCFPATTGVLKYITEGSTMKVEGSVLTKSAVSVNLENVIIDDFGD